MHPSSTPLMDKRNIGKRLGVCSEYDLKEGVTELMWVLGEVVDVSDSFNILKSDARTSCYKRVKLL